MMSDMTDSTEPPPSQLCTCGTYRIFEPDETVRNFFGAVHRLEGECDG